MAAIMMADMTHTKLHYTLLENRKKQKIEKIKTTTKCTIVFLHISTARCAASQHVLHSPSTMLRMTTEYNQKTSTMLRMTTARSRLTSSFGIFFTDCSSTLTSSSSTLRSRSSTFAYIFIYYVVYYWIFI